MEIQIELTEFYSYGDEKLFFDALGNFRGVQKIVGLGRGLVLTLNLSKMNRESVRDLIALLRRYRISLRPLSALADTPKFNWMREPTWYWATAMFGIGPDGSCPLGTLPI
jgi:hypothetical protein